MDGAKLITDTVDIRKNCGRLWRPGRAEAFSKGGVDLTGMKILAVVGS
jgi:hypothetical protein